MVMILVVTNLHITIDNIVLHVLQSWPKVLGTLDKILLVTHYWEVGSHCIFLMPLPPSNVGIAGGSTLNESTSI